MELLKEKIVGAGAHLGTFFIKTYGCDMNKYDSDKMHTMLVSSGLIESSDIAKANVVIVNTCHIREKATETLYSLIGRLREIKKQNNAHIIIAGCVAQAEGEEVINRIHGVVDAIIGPQAISSLPVIINQMLTGEEISKINLDFNTNKFDEIPVHSSKNNLIANLTIQEGCDKFCKFCCVPYTRGAEYSRSPEEIFNEALSLVNSGAKTINLLGQNVNAYRGISKITGKECNLGILIMDYIEQIEGLERIFYTTSHPNDMHQELYAAHRDSKKLMKLMHLPVQSGSNKILKDMNRKHTREEYFKTIDKIRSYSPNIAFSTDMIVGYPGENEQDFQDTIDLVEKVKYAQAFFFKYSPRP